MDVVDRATRSRIMASIRSSGTAPERAARLVARLSGVPHRVNARDLPGSPDLAFDEDRLAVFIHGCFWHRHSCPRGRRVPGTNAAFWIRKFGLNVRRDHEVQTRLRAMGWTVVVMWECEL